MASSHALAPSTRQRPLAERWNASRPFSDSDTFAALDEAIHIPPWRRPLFWGDNGGNIAPIHDPWHRSQERGLHVLACLLPPPFAARVLKFNGAQHRHAAAARALCAGPGGMHRLEDPVPAGT